MKSIYIAFALLVVAVTANPIFQSEDVGEEFVGEEIGQEHIFSNDNEDWQLVPDSEGYLHLVDINSVNMEAEPQFVPINDVIFRLWTRQNTAAGQIIPINNNAQLDASNFVASRQTIFHIHGWNGGGPVTGAQIRQAYINHIDCNVMVVDWGAGAQTPNYILARNRVSLVGAVVAQFINWLFTVGVSPGNVVIVGHSLGGHVAGAAGARTNQLVQAVIGLDSAGPLFSLDDPDNRIDASDAQYVECHITDAGRLGFQHPVCDTNFYPNWGTSQPGCGTDLSGACSHARTNELMAASLAHHLSATRCGGGLQDIVNRNCVVAGANRRLGGHPPNDGPSPPNSVFFLPTTATYPFVV